MTVTQLAELEMQARDVQRYKPGGAMVQLPPDVALSMITLLRQATQLAAAVAVSAA